MSKWGGNCARNCFLLFPLRDVQLKPRLSFPERQAKTADSVNELLWISESCFSIDLSHLEHQVVYQHIEGPKQMM